MFLVQAVEFALMITCWVDSSKNFGMLYNTEKMTTGIRNVLLE